ncbi:MAG TPA: glycosidase, partial [Candidatus Sumerlaeota bacterium]|nr:glycosidase [Candidatus Sumerlaeota bacterium]
MMNVSLKSELLKRYPGNPILTYKDLPFNANAVYNCGAVKFGDEYILVPRVEDGRRDNKLHIARSNNGIHFRIEPEPIPIAPDPETEIWEYHRYDPRVTYLEGVYYITYCAQNFGEIVRIGCIRTSDFKSFEHLPFFTPPWNRNCALFPERIKGSYVRMERPMNGNMAVNLISFSPDLIHWGRHRIVE